MIWIIVAFLAGVGIGCLCARLFFPIVCTKVNIVEEVVKKDSSVAPQ